MNEIFADTLYWIAITIPVDQWRDQALKARRRLGDVILVASEEVLIEYLNAFSSRGDKYRSIAVEIVKEIISDVNILTIPQSHRGFQNGLKLFESRCDKSYSLTDCISMNIMKERAIDAILTNDRYFMQEGFNILIR